ncbi:MAG TPA: hypothetical protein VEI06_01895 [Gemmatimonadaceae bacterium]|nr:hypothetical protein [Gemmatimonadaceae bacterium]
MLIRRRFEWNRELFFVLALVVIGSVMRWVWPGDMEWKGDEQWMYRHARDAAATGAFPPVGMMSGGGVVNPGLALWIFALVARVAHDPIAMVRFVQGLNIAAIWAFLLCYCLHFEPQARRPWLWGIGFGSVSCLPVVLSRKLWAQCLLPPFGFLVFLGHLHRRAGWGAFLWGFASALLCQIHMSGFFFSAGLLLWTLWRDRATGILRDTRWMYVLAGGVVGGVGLIPWLHALPGGQPHTSVAQIFTLRFYWLWLALAWGIDIQHSMAHSFWTGFLREPLLAGYPTWLMLAAHIFLLACGLRALYLVVRSPMPDDDARFYVRAAAIGMGVLITLSGVVIPEHYLIVLFPLAFVWAASIYRGRPRLLAAIAVAQLLVTATFLVHIHRFGGATQSGPVFERFARPTATDEYGATYRSQGSTWCQADGCP